MSRSQPAETRSNKSNCRIRSNRSSTHLEVARDVEEFVAPHCLGFDTLLMSTSASADRESAYELLRGNITSVGAERFHCTEFTTNLYRAS